MSHLDRRPLVCGHRPHTTTISLAPQDDAMRPLPRRPMTLQKFHVRTAAVAATVLTGERSINCDRLHLDRRRPRLLYRVRIGDRGMLPCARHSSPVVDIAAPAHLVLYVADRSAPTHPVRLRRVLHIDGVHERAVPLHTTRTPRRGTSRLFLHDGRACYHARSAHAACRVARAAP